MISSKEIVEQIGVAESAQPARARSLGSLLARGASTLGVASVLDRGFGFLANLLAARAAGAQVFGAYAVVLATAGMVANYAGAGIGATANRFSGQYPRERAAYGKFLWVLVVIGLSSALAAASVMLLGAGPIARLMLGNEALAPLLRLAALSSGAFILLECLRGLLVGQQRLVALLVLSAITGVGFLVLLPTAAHVGAEAMLACQAGVVLFAIVVCVLLARSLGITPQVSSRQVENVQGPNVRSVFVFGLYQLGSVIGISIAGWWIASLVARADTSLVQMGIYAVAHQFRGIASIAPGVLMQVCYSRLTDESGSEYGGADRVLLISTFASTVFAVSVAGLAIGVLPWVLSYLYGSSYAGGEIPCALLLATAIVHMSGGPAAQRMSIVALRALGVINAVWAAVIILLGIVLVPRFGAAGAGCAFLIGHIISQLSVLRVLRRAGSLSNDLLMLSFISLFNALAFASLAIWRASSVANHSLFNLAFAALLAVSLIALLLYGKNRGWLPVRLSKRKTLEQAG